MTDSEIPLSGGNTNLGVVRIEDTVHRAVGKFSPTVHRFLKFLASQKFAGAPTFLGIDEIGREILSYMPGHCEVDEYQWLSDSYVISSATLLRNFHQCSSKFIPTATDSWAYSYPDASMHQVICHNDFAPYNLINNGHEFVSIIDFDLIGPGPRLRDVAYCAFWIAPLSQNDKSMREHALADLNNGSRRLKLFCNAYGITLDSSLLDMVSSILVHMADEKAMIAMIGAERTSLLKADGHLLHWHNEAKSFETHRRSIEENL